MEVDLAGTSRFLIGENAIGKSSFLAALARALGKDYRSLQYDDFSDATSPIEIQVTLSDLDENQLGVFVDAADFGVNTALTVGVLAAWDPDAEECVAKHGYPTQDWRSSNRAERDAFGVLWVPDTRDPSRLLQIGSRRSVIGDVLGRIDLENPISAAIDELKATGEKLAGAGEIQNLLQAAGTELSGFIPDVAHDVFGLTSIASTELTVLRQLQLTLRHGGPALPFHTQSSGLSQLSLFAFAITSIRDHAGHILLIDEPELALHPQCQRALLAMFDRLPNQYVIATHSASLLDGADPRRILRLHRNGGAVTAARPSTLSDTEARVLARFTTARNAEAFFARIAILVEGESDRFAIEALARRKNRNLDAEGISIVVLQGAATVQTFLSLLGPRGLQVRLAGLCDMSHVAVWGTALQTHGLCATTDRQAMEDAGFFVCDTDLEEMLIDALGEAEVLKVIETQGEADTFARYAQQRAHADKTEKEQLHGFLHSRGRQVRYAPLLIDSIDLDEVPPPLERLLDGV